MAKDNQKKKIKESINNLKKDWKEEIVNVLLAFGVALIARFAFYHFNPPIENLLFMIIFFVIYFGLSNKK